MSDDHQVPDYPDGPDYKIPRADDVFQSANDMSLLDHFACQAMVGLLSQTDHSEYGYPCPAWDGDRNGRKRLAKRAYSIAEAMLVQRSIIAADAREKGPPHD